MTPTLSPRAMLREAVSLRLEQDHRLTHQAIADRAGIPRPRISEALHETVPCPNCAYATGKPHARCKPCGGVGRVPTGEPRPETVERILRALEFAMTIVDVRQEETR